MAGMACGKGKANLGIFALRFEASFGCMLEAENITKCTKTGQGLLGPQHVFFVYEKGRGKMVETILGGSLEFGIVDIYM